MRLSISLPSTCEKDARFPAHSIAFSGLCRSARLAVGTKAIGEGAMPTSRLSISAGRELTEPTPAAAIDDDHLRQMTLGDPALEREVLEIFMRQAALMLRRIAGAKPALAAAAAHTLKGSARGIGAWRVAQAAAGGVFDRGSLRVEAADERWRPGFRACGSRRNRCISWPAVACGGTTWRPKPS